MLSLNIETKPGFLKGNKQTAKINEGQAALIRQAARTGKFTRQTMARVFGLHESQISRILQRKRWA